MSDDRYVDRGLGAPTDLPFGELGVSPGSIPSPEVLAHYNAIVPGAATRILNMAEEQSRHRLALEQDMAEAEAKRAHQAVESGSIIVMLCIGAGFLLVFSGRGVPGLVIAMAGILLFIGIFLYAVNSRRLRLHASLTPARYPRGPRSFDL